LRRAIESGRQVELNGMRSAAVPVATWHGDPICEPHLYRVWEAEGRPTTVRMAQWRGR
jgi:hypothetical protein